MAYSIATTCVHCNLRRALPTLRTLHRATFSTKMFDKRPASLNEKQDEIVVLKWELSAAKNFYRKEMIDLNAFFLPHLLVNLSGLGAPFFDYYGTSLLPLTAGTVALSSLPVLVLLYDFNKLTTLKVNTSDQTVHFTTPIKKCTVPLSVCTLRTKTLHVSSTKFKFHPAALTRHKKFTRAKALMEKASRRKKDGDEAFHFNMLKGLTLSPRYLIIAVVSSLMVVLTYLFTGYMDVGCVVYMLGVWRFGEEAEEFMNQALVKIPSKG